MRSFPAVLLAVSTLSISLTACSIVSSSGPTKSQVQDTVNASVTAGIQIVDVTEDVAQRLLAERQGDDFARALGNNKQFQQQLGVGDTIEVSVWEAPPATLFGASVADPRVAPSNARVTVLPEQMVSGDGYINVPFAGQMKAAGRTTTQLERDITAALKGKANQPQVLVRLSKNVTSYVTVVGDVAASTRMQLTPRGERLLDAVASAGGVRQPVEKMTIQVTRGSEVQALPLQTIIRDPRQNVPLRAGDVVTALYQPLSFTALGATGKNQEVNFEAQGITLAQAIARAGGLDDARSDAQGVFLFRFEDAKALPWPRQPVRTTQNGKVPVIYRINLKDPGSFFVAQTFPVDNKDLLYVSNAPITELQKFLNVVFSVAYPVVTTVNTFK
ncbi:polysaccharide biosynthesis/export family protein [Cupriavidus sp. CuC1]|uniref:polysaccharide biosynthesis/export family protein n=1 Tax=Cupriavidus sp. CuC1 TaxID=3373131 RepID=UPI0037D767E1